MKTELTMLESLEREHSRVFPTDMSEHTLLNVAHSKNCIEALRKQVAMECICKEITKEQEDCFLRIYRCRCPSCNNVWLTACPNEKRCPECGQLLKNSGCAGK